MLGTEESNDKVQEAKPEVTVVDFTTMSQSEITTWCDTYKIKCSTKEEYSDTVAKGSFVSQSTNKDDKIIEGSSVTIVYSLGKEPTIEYRNALAKAKTYQTTMNMSKKAIYDQLVSQYGEKFTASEAQYAIDNLDS